MKAELPQRHLMRMNPQQTHGELREIWALVSEHPGISVQRIAATMDISLSRSVRLVGLLLKSGTLVREKRKGGTLRAPVPLITAKSP